jgi:hypothetical protein
MVGRFRPRIPNVIGFGLQYGFIKLDIDKLSGRSARSGYDRLPLYILLPLLAAISSLR